MLEPRTEPDEGAPLRADLRRALRTEHRRFVAWLAAGVLVAGAALAAGLTEAAIVAGAFGGGFAAWSARLVAGLRVTLRDLGKGDPSRRAVVLLLHDPNPRAVRPLLALWSEAPPAGERLPKPESVWRCDDELLALESYQGEAELHEAWVDHAPRGWSTIRWVYADSGPAVPHRRAIFGRLLMRLLLRGDRPGPPAPLTVPDPQTQPETGQELPLKGSLARSFAWRVLAVAVLAALVPLFD